MGGETFIEEQLLRIKRKFSRYEEYNLLIESHNKLEKELSATKVLLQTLRTDYYESEAENKKLKAEIKDLKSALEKNGGVTRKTHERVAHELKQVREELADLKRPIIKAQIEKQNAELRELLLNQKQT